MQALLQHLSQHDSLAVCLQHAASTKITCSMDCMRIAATEACAGCKRAMSRTLSATPLAEAACRILVSSSWPTEALQQNLCR